MFLTAYAKSTSEFISTMAANRRLASALAKRDLADEYIGHTLSVSWAVVHPLFVMLVYLFIFTVIFPTKVTAPPSNSADAVVYLLAGIIPWLALSQVMGRSSGAIVGNSAIVKQMAFPLELLPVKVLAGPLVFGAISLAFLVCYGVWITGGALLVPYLLGLPLLILLSLLLFVGISLTLSCAQVFLRDLKELVNMFLTIGLFTHPILYFPDAVPAAIRPVIYASPFSYFIFCWQDIMFYGGIERGWAWIIAFVFAAALFIFGARLFVVSKNHFGDFL